MLTVYVLKNLERMKYVTFWFSYIHYRIQCWPVQYSYIPWPTKWTLFGKAFAHVRNCLRKEKHMYGTNKNIDGFYTKTTQTWGFRVKIKKKVLYRLTPFFNTYTVSIIQYLFTAESYFESRIASSFFILFFFFQEKTLGDIWVGRYNTFFFIFTQNPHICVVFV
jgi:hypothetical protein